LKAECSYYHMLLVSVVLDCLMKDTIRKYLFVKYFYRLLFY
jgi:hypothetical protein